MDAAGYMQYFESRSGSPYGAADVVAKMVAPGWQWFYEYQKDPADGGDRYAAGVRSYATALMANGYFAGVNPDLPVWGNYKRDRTVQFQRAHGLQADGVVGPITGRYLARVYVEERELKYAVPNHLIGRQGTLESNNHAAAQGWADPKDEGWGQIHLPFHPDVTQRQAWDLKFSVSFLANELVGNYTQLHDYDAAVAAYNVGFSTAKAWLAAGKPPSGGPVWHTPSGDVDSFTRAHEYVELVKASPY